MKAIKTLTVLAAMSVATYAHGAVVLQDTYSAGASNGPAVDLGGVFGYEITPAGFTAAGSDKLVLVYSGHDGNVPGTPDVTSVTYNGVAMTEAIQDVDNGAIVNAGIWYLDNVVADGTLRIELASGTTVHSGVGLYAVDGLAAGGPADTGTGRTNAELAANAPVTISTSEGFFVQEYTRNNQSVSDIADDYLLLHQYSPDSYRSISQYRVTDAAGDYFAPGNYGGENFRRIVTAGFEAVPEPSSLALLGLGGLLIARRRRG